MTAPPVAPRPTGRGKATDPSPPSPLHQRHRLPKRWPAVLGVISAAVIFGDGQPIDLRTFGAVLVLMSVIYVGLGLLRHELGDRREQALQVGALVAFTAVTLTAISVDPDRGRLVLAFGWFAHGAWDLVHHWRGRIVPRGWSEWCGVVDVFGGVAILVLPVDG